MKIRWNALGTSVALSLLFIAVYSTCNWLTSLRHDVGSWHFSWERSVPFVPLMVLPYMSIDLFFVAAPFLCRDDQERRLFARRIAAAILISGLCFLLFPLRFAFERPYADGWLGVVFNQFRSIDQPFNEFPSLHVTLWMILANLYAQRLKGLLRLATGVWFVLIGLSTVLTHQHHVVDVIGGFVLAGCLFYAIRATPFALPVICNRRVGSYYLSGAVALAIASFAARPWSFVLLWPAVPLGLVAMGYFGLGPGVFRKERGRLPLSTWFVLWPVLVGQRLSLWYYARRCRAWDALDGHLWIGRKLSDREAREAIAAGVCAVVDLTAEFSEARPFVGIAYLNVPVLDLTQPTAAQIDAALHFIHAHAGRGVVYVHCKIGYSRTAAVAGAYLMATRQDATVDDAAILLRAARPSIVIRPEAAAALRSFHARIGCPAPAAMAENS